MALATASSLWSIDRNLTVAAILPISALMAAGLVLVAGAPRMDASGYRLEKMILAGFAFALVVFLFESVTENWLTRTARGLDWEILINDFAGNFGTDPLLKNGTVILSLLYWPLAATLLRRGRWPAAIIAWTLLFYLAIDYSAETAALSLIVGAIISGLAAWRAKLVTGALAIIFAVGVLAAPIAADRLLAPINQSNVGKITQYPQIPFSIANRLLTWKFVETRIWERPWAGWGFRSSRAIPGGNEKFAIEIVNPETKSISRVLDFNIPLHPHNQWLQIWLELGVGGALIVALFGAGFIYRARRLNLSKSFAATLPGLITSVLIFASASFGAWQNWWIATVFLAIAFHRALASQGEARGK